MIDLLFSSFCNLEIILLKWENLGVLYVCP